MPKKRGTNVGQRRIRIIGGRFRGRRIDVEDRDGLRPTPDRLRETLFNWLGHDVSGADCLDLFAGSGAVGIEALSRGADKVTFVEADTAAMNTLSQNLARLGCMDQVELRKTDAVRFLRRADRRWDIVFLDPPFQSHLLEPLLKWFSTGQNLGEGALVYVEHETTAPPAFPTNLQPLKRSRVGASTGSLLRLGDQ